MKKIIIFITLTISTLTFSQEQTETVKGNVQSETSKSILQNVHVINLTKVKGTITNNKGEFEIKAKLNDTLYFSYIGYKSLKIAPITFEIPDLDLLPASYPRLGNPIILYLVEVFTGAFLTSISK